jgi:peroxiredoxin
MIVVLFLGLAWINLSRVTDATLMTQTVEAPKAGFLAPDFRLTTTDGDTVQLSDLRGTPVIVNFWATWCPPCRKEMPALEAVWQRYGQGGVVILGVDQGERADVVTRFAREEVGTTFPLLLDIDQSVGARYAVQALPTTVFVDGSGRIQDVVVGGALDEAALIGGVNKILGDSRLE